MENKTLKIDYIRFLNFKGFRDKRIEFGAHTQISGANATGKTTVFDGFTWCLFGKDSHDRKQFSIKTLDADNVAIPKIPHEVEVGLDIDGNKVVLCRRYNEKWVGMNTPKEKFLGHEEERLINGVPFSVAEWKERIESIISEDIFKYVTNPHHFTSQKPDVQRALLFKMAGGVTDDAVRSSNERFNALFEEKGGKSLADFRREVESELNRIKKEKIDIPARIDENKRDISGYEGIVRENAEKEVSLIETELSEVRNILSGRKTALDLKAKERETLMKEYSEATRARDNRRMEVDKEASAAYYQAKHAYEDKIANLKAAKRDKGFVESDIESQKAFLAQYNSEREKLLEEYRKIEAEQLTFGEDEFICPTCGREFEADDIERKKDEMLCRFNEDKARRLEGNKKTGIEIRKKIDECEAEILKLQESVVGIDSRISDLQNALDAMPVPVEPAYEELIVDDKPYNDLCGKIAEIKTKLDAMTEESTDDEERKLREKDSALTDALTSARRSLWFCDARDNGKKRIAELESQLSVLSEKEAHLKGLIFDMDEFSKTRSRMLSDKVNSLFRFVKFKLFETQINGEEKETCEAMVNGVPYADVNNAGQILAGLDIIRAIQRYTGVVAPIWIDNSESITDWKDGLLDGIGQTIMLAAVKGKELTVSEHE